MRRSPSKERSAGTAGKDDADNGTGTEHKFEEGGGNRGNSGVEGDKETDGGGGDGGRYVVDHLHTS